MQITIHRGTDQIGGGITEISTSKARVIVDMGDNLPSETNATEEEKAALVSRIFYQNQREDEAVIYTHGHGDHVGLMCYVPSGVRQYLAHGTKKLLLDRYQRLSRINPQEYTRWLDSVGRSYSLQRVFRVGDILIRPFKVSHSAYDSHMFLIEADGESVLHTGDFRGHGYFMKDLPERLAAFANPVDYLIIEGTMLHRDHVAPQERGIADRIQDVIQRHKNVIVLTSAMSYERVMSVGHALIRSHTGKPLITCSPHWEKALEIYAAENSRYAFVYKNYLYNFDPDRDRRVNVKLENWIEEKGMVVLAGVGQKDTIRKIVERYDTDGGDLALVYSVWKGYLSAGQRKISPDYGEIHDLFPSSNVYYIHTSGHADTQTLEKVIKAVNPRKAIIGIHKEAGASFTELDLSVELKSKIIPDRQSLDNVVVKHLL